MSEHSDPPPAAIGAGLPRFAEERAESVQPMATSSAGGYAAISIGRWWQVSARSKPSR